jgi:hypothetical protein
MRFSEEVRLARAHFASAPAPRKSTNSEHPRPAAAAAAAAADADMRPQPPHTNGAPRDVLHQVMFDFEQACLNRLLASARDTDACTAAMRDTITEALTCYAEAAARLYMVCDALKTEFGVTDPDHHDAVQRLRCQWTTTPNEMGRLDALLDQHRRAHRIAVVLWDTKRALFLAMLAHSARLRRYVFADDDAARTADGIPAASAVVASAMAKHLELFCERYVTRTEMPQHALVEQIGLQLVHHMENLDLLQYDHVHRRSSRPRN